MAFTLANEEEIIKSWNVASTASSIKTKQEIKLSVTNKRIVLENEGKDVLGRNEILLKEVSGVGVSSFKKRKSKAPIVLLSIMLLIIGLIFIIHEDPPTVLGVIFMIIGFAILFIKLPVTYAFKLTIYTKALSSQLIDISAGLNLLAMNNKITTVNIPPVLVVNEKTIKDIADTLNAIIIDNNK